MPMSVIFKTESNTVDYHNIVLPNYPQTSLIRSLFCLTPLITVWVCWHTIKSSKYIHHGHSLSAALLSKLHLHCQHVLVRGDSNSIAKMIARTRSRLTLVAASPQAPNPNLLSDLEGLWGQRLPYHSIIKTGHKKLCQSWEKNIKELVVGYQP